MKKIALTTRSGTACSETVLLAYEDTPIARASIEAQFCNRSDDDAPVAGSWTDVTGNDAC